MDSTGLLQVILYLIIGVMALNGKSDCVHQEIFPQVRKEMSSVWRPISSLDLIKELCCAFWLEFLFLGFFFLFVF